MSTLGALITYNASTLTYTIKPGATTSSIQSLLDTAVPGHIFSFAAGTHILTDTLELHKSGVTIKGAGKDKTTFLFDLDTPADAIVVEGSVGSWSGQLAQNATQNASTITLKNTSGLKVGDFLHIQQENTDDFLNANGYGNIVDSTNASKNPINESFVEIASVNGNTITLKTPITHDMAASVTTVKSVNMLHDVTLADFTLTYNLGTPDADSFTTALPAYLGTISINIIKTMDTEVLNVSVLNAPSHSLEFRTNLSPHVNNFSANGAHNKDGTGDGYGLQIAETYYGVFENLDIQNTRHAVVFSSWHTEVGNTVHVLSTNRDINYHGGPDYNNVVTVDHDLYRSGDTIWRIVSSGGSDHPTTNIDDNTTLFGVAQGGSKADIIHGWNKGAWLDGGLGNDILYGGTGNDIILAGKGYDDLYGGAGRDKFAFRPGDGRDDIWDFNTAQDYIVLDGFSGVTAFSHVAIVYAGGNASISVKGETLATLYGVGSGKLSAQNFIFNTPDIYAPPTKSEPVIVAELKPIEPPSPPITSAGITFNASSKIENFTGGTGFDTVKGYAGHINTADTITLGAGYDTLKILSGAYTFDSKLYSKFSGIDHLDLLSANGKGKVVLDKGFLERTDSDALTITFGSGGLALLDTSALTPGHYQTVWQSESVTVRLIPSTPLLAPVIAGVTTNATSKLDVITGTTGGDTVRAYSSQLSTGDGISLGDGHDTIKMLSGSFLFDTKLYTKLSGIDAIDVTASGGKVILDNSFIDSSDLNTINIVYGKSGVQLLDTSHIDATRFKVKLEGGGGKVTLSSGDDILYGSNADDIIIGGEGKDTLNGGGGADTFLYTSVLEGGDLIEGFGPDDSIDLQTLFDNNGLGGKTAAQAIASGHVQLQQQGGDLVLSFDADGFAGSAHSSVVLVTLDNTLSINFTAMDIIA